MFHETQAWLEADWMSDWGKCNWGTEGIPARQPVRCIPGRGIAIARDDRTVE
ncbi:MAG TPA: hypothetical protein IGS17_12650 [Oscillatoriales cyanobacterium M59_W2019_021]|nr:hypothetical protein [Oscillatoriales cyanobacterium M4454_W2019_049]HIK51753.1 hypothetical protein [Oscillatoriales cyanobacterium M59_W2019_021]